MADLGCQKRAGLVVIGPAIPAYLTMPPLLTPTMHPVLAGFVARSGSQLTLDGSPFYFAGFNAYWMTASVGFGEGYLVDGIMADAQVCGSQHTQRLHAGPCWARVWMGCP